MIKTMLANRILSTWTRRSFVSFFQNVYLHRVIPTTLIYTGPHLVQVITTTLPRPSTLLFMKTSLLFENVSNDMLYKTSPSSSSKKPIYPHCVNHLLAFVPNCDFMLLYNIFTLIVWRSKAMENRWWWWTTFGVRADDGFAENIFRGIARLVAERPACENLFYKKKWNMAPPRFLLPPPPPLWPKSFWRFWRAVMFWDLLIKSKLLSLSQVICWFCSDLGLSAVGYQI
jgi:hypothetical protein